MSERDEIAGALPDYEIGGELGRGGFGLVLAGRHRQLRRDVAIKELPPALAADPRVRSRFAAEARILASLNHPHIVPIYDYVERDGLCLLVMENLPGGTLWDRFRSQGMGIETTCAVIMAACTGLHYAHQKGVLHRDVKPENLLYNAEGVLKITDFGIAKVVGGAETLATRGGEILGTPAYMAPEQAEGRELGPEADIYATGVMLYELLSGNLPFSEEGGPLAIVYRHVYEEPTPLSKVAPHVEPSLAEVTMRAIARQPANRYSSAEDFGVAIGGAVTPAWGTEWLQRAGMPIVDSGPITESAKRPTAGTVSGPSTAGAAAPPLPGAPSTIIAGPPTAPPPGVPPTVGPPGAPPTVGPSPAHVPAAGGAGRTVGPGSGGVTVVRPQLEDHVVRGAEVLVGAELVPVRQVIELPSPPYVLAAAALVLFIVTFGLALIGLGKPSIPLGLTPRTATVAGADPTNTSTIKLDLSQPIPVQLTQVPANVTSVQIALSVGGIPLPASATVPLTAAGAVQQASVSATSDRYLVGGTVTGDLKLIGGGKTLAQQKFLAKGKQSPFLSVPGVLVIALFLFFVAYMESLLRPLRRGRRGVSGVVGMALLGAGLGATIVGLTWLLGSPEPTISTVIVCAIFGSGAAIAGSLAAIRIARRARIKPRVKAAR